MKACIVCPNFNWAVVRKQPWRYVYELSTRLVKFNVQVVLISNKVPYKTFEGITVRSTKNLRPFFLLSNTPLLRVLRSENPDVVFWLVGPSSFFYLSWLKKNNFRNILLLTGPLYSIQDIAQLGLRNAISLLPHIWVNLIGTLVPKALVRAVVNAPFTYGVIVLSERNKSILERRGVDQRKIFVIPPGVDEFNYVQVVNNNKLSKIRKKLGIAPNDFVVLFLGPATKPRGADALVESIALVHKEMPSLKVIILARRMGDPFAVKGEHKLSSLIAKLKLGHIIRIIAGALPSDEIKEFMVASDVVMLPFRLVQSDVPITVLEALTAGKPIISTNVDGIPEWLKRGNGIVVKNAQPHELAKALVMFCSSRNRLTRNIKIYGSDCQLPTWDDVVSKVAEVIRTVATPCQ